MDTIKKVVASDGGRKDTCRLVADIGGDSIKVPLVLWEAISSTLSSTTDTKSNASSALNQVWGVSNPPILAKPTT